MEGISRLSLRDVKIAQRAGYRVKLLGRAVRLPGGRTAYVAPHLIPEEQPLASVDDVFNAVVVRGNATGEVMFYGQGAGELPTASACVADVMEALQSSPRREEIGWEADPAGSALFSCSGTRRALRTRRPFGAGTTSASAAASAPLPRPSARWRSSARTAVRPPSSPTASAEPRQGSRPKACASWPVCGCWDKPQTAGRCVYWNRREPGFET